MICIAMNGGSLTHYGLGIGGTAMPRWRLIRFPPKLRLLWRFGDFRIGYHCIGHRTADCKMILSVDAELFIYTILILRIWLMEFLSRESVALLACRTQGTQECTKVLSIK